MAGPDIIYRNGKKLERLSDLYPTATKAQIIREKAHWRKWNWKGLTIVKDRDGDFGLYGYLPGGKKALALYWGTAGFSGKVSRKRAVEKKRKLRKKTIPKRRK